jgi:acetyl-CoA carboxylase carboxyltransferase component
MVFMEDTTGFKPGREQEAGGIVQAGRAMLDAIIDLRTPRFLVIIRNAFGGAYASYNNYPTGADLVIALPTTRAAVMGPAGVEFIYKDELREIRSALQKRISEGTAEQIKAGLSEADARAQAEKTARQWAKEQEVLLAQRYEKELMNPNEALSLGSISQIVMPSDLRKVVAENLRFHLEHYVAEPLNAVQREFH